MAKTKQAMIYGPWPGGMNIKDDPEFLSDSQLTLITNMDVTDEGRLIPRPAIIFDTTLDPGVVVQTPSFPYVGSVPQGSGSHVYAIFGIFSTGQFKRTKDPVTGYTTSTFTGTTANTNYYDVINYDGYTYYLSTTGASSFKVVLDAFTGAVTLTPNVPNSAIGPDGGTGRAFIFKDRLWVVNANRIYYSKVTDPTTFAAPDGGFFDVGPGDGDTINQVLISNDSMYIFKQNAVWVFRFTSDPGTDGFLQIISEGKGALNAIVYENTIYTVDAVSVYVFVNGQFEDIGRSLNFQPFEGRVYPLIGIWSNRLFVTNDQLYVMNLKNGAWSIYRSNFIEFSFSESRLGHSYDSDAVNHVAFFSFFEGIHYVTERPGYVSDKIKYVTYDLFDNPTVAIKYHIPYRNIITKKFSFDDTFNWKRLYSFKVEGIDAFNDDGEWLNKGRWYFQDENFNRTGTINGSPVVGAGPAVNKQDFEKVPVGSFRFKRLLLAYMSDDEELTQAESAPIEGQRYGAFDIDPTYGTPVFHKLRLDVALKTDISK